MKKILAALLLLAPSCLATTTMTGNIKDLGGTAQTNTFIRFWLRGCNGNQPRVAGTGLIAPSQGGVFYFDAVPNGSGTVSKVLYATTGSGGTGDGEIECGGSKQAVWYGMQVYNNGKPGPEVPIAAPNTGTVDLSSVTPISSTPVVAAPTGDTTYVRLDGGNAASVIPYAQTFKQVNNIRFADAYCTTAGVYDQSCFTNALASLSNGPGWIIASPRIYSFTTALGTITISKARQHIVGAGKWATEIDVDSTFTGPVFKYWTGVAPPGTVLYQNSIGGIAFNGSGNTTKQKIAIQPIDTSELHIYDIAVLNWTGNSSSSATPSMGFDLQGRELTSIERVSINADRPVNMNLDPNLVGGQSSDALHIQDGYFMPISTESCIVVVPGSIISHWSMDGNNTCAGGAHAIDWTDTTAAAAISQQINIENFHHEQGTDATAYSFNIVRSNAGAAYIQQITFTNCAAWLGGNGFFLQRTHNATLINPIHARAGGTALNADNTNFNTGVIGAFFQAGATVTNSAQTASTDFNQNSGLISAMGGVKIGASGSTVSDSRELIQSLHGCGTTSTCSNNGNASYREIFGTITLSTGAATLSSITAFTSTASFACTCTDQTAANACKAVPASTTSVTFAGTGSDVLAYSCRGN